MEKQKNIANKKFPRAYLGDSVYAEFTGSMVTLTTDNGEGPINTIHLEPSVIQALNEFYDEVTR